MPPPWQPSTTTSLKVSVPPVAWMHTIPVGDGPNFTFRKYTVPLSMLKPGVVALAMSADCWPTKRVAEAPVARCQVDAVDVAATVPRITTSVLVAPTARLTGSIEQNGAPAVPPVVEKVAVQPVVFCT